MLRMLERSDITRRLRAESFSRCRGFTLIELLVAMAILGIILAVAIPNYRQWVLESARAEAKAVLMGGSSALERCFTRFSAYDAGGCQNIRDELNGKLSESGKYQLAVTAVASSTFDLSAAPQGGQTDDTECGTFTLNQAGRRGAAGGFDAAVIAKCW